MQFGENNSILTCLLVNLVADDITYIERFIQAEKIILFDLNQQILHIEANNIWISDWLFDKDVEISELWMRNTRVNSLWSGSEDGI